MIAYPRMNINLAGIKENAAKMKDMCDEQGINLTGVVKGAAGDANVARAFLQGGIKSLGDSRLRNIKHLQENGIEAEYMLLRLPDPEEAEKVVKLADISLNSELKTLRNLSRAAEKLNKSHRVIIMVDVGDLREGLWENELDDFMERALELPKIEIAGLGTNVGCYGGVLPTRKNTEKLLQYQESLQAKYSINLPIVSGGNTATTILLNKAEMPDGINHLRVGEGILQGTDVTHQRQLPEFNQQNITVSARIIELKEKPSVPVGKTGHDAFGGKPEFADRGIRKRAILALGRQDIRLDGLTAVKAGAEVIGASSDHLLVDITEVESRFKVGDTMEFELGYGAMLAGMNSPYTSKIYQEE